MNRIRLAAVLLVAGSLACIRWQVQQKTIDEYILAVQAADHLSCYRLMAPELRDAIAGIQVGSNPDYQAFSRSMDLLHQDFEGDRKKGRLNFSQEGIALIRALGLGRGAFYLPDFSRSTTRGEGAVVLVQVVLPYDILDRPDLARPGRVFWRLGRPFGGIYPLLSGLPFTGEREELDRIQIRVDLVPCKQKSEPSPTGWCVLAVSPLPETAEYNVVAPNAQFP